MKKSILFLFWVSGYGSFPVSDVVHDEALLPGLGERRGGQGKRLGCLLLLPLDDEDDEDKDNCKNKSTSRHDAKLTFGRD